MAKKIDIEVLAFIILVGLVNCSGGNNEQAAPAPSPAAIASTTPRPSPSPSLVSSPLPNGKQPADTNQSEGCGGGRRRHDHGFYGASLSVACMQGHVMTGKLKQLLVALALAGSLLSAL
jgi:hypothetical protein